MKTTVEIPDDLFRRAKAEAALRGRTLEDLVKEGLRRVISAPSGDDTSDLLRERLFTHCGVYESGTLDLATNPEHMDGLGLDSREHR